jgi:energy-coupling factor transporter ATP-binding protein EcfA2
MSVGGWIDKDKYTVPFLLNTNNGGFCFEYDEHSEIFCFDLLENIVFDFIEQIPINHVSIHVLDFSIKNRFPYLSQLKSENIYNLFSRKNAKDEFEKLLEISRTRHHEILTPATPTVSIYNETSNFKEKYHLLLINLEHFPSEIIMFNEIKSFFDSCFEAGFFILTYTSKEMKFSKPNDSFYYLYDKFQIIKIKNNNIKVNENFFPYMDLYTRYNFNHIDLNTAIKKEKFSNRIETKISDRPDFLKIEIGTSLDNREKRYFRLGDETFAYHAFITGISGSGKTTLINNIITGIASNYKKEEIKLYLMDYKEGTEFSVFENHPNCEKIYLDNENLQASIIMLEEFVNISAERGDKFRNLKVSDINSYNKITSEERMPHCILIIDEVHKLFSNNFEYKQQQHFNSLLETIAKQGRSFGLHLILTTQSLEGVNINKSIMNQIPLRISYKLQNHMEAMKIFNENNTKEVLNLDRYVFISNDKGGIKEANKYGRASYYSREEITSKINFIKNEKNYSSLPILIEKNIQVQDVKIEKKIEHENELENELEIKDDFLNKKFETSSEKELLERYRLLEQKNEK